jgi:hypothetical protein
MLLRTAVVILSCAAWVPAAAGGESSLVALAPAGSEVLVGIHLRQIVDSDFGKAVAAQLAGQSNGQLQGLVAVSGFDPMRDLDEILIAAPAKQNATPLLLLRGRFDAAKLAQLAAMGGMKGADYHGVQVLARAGQQGGFSALAVLDPTLVVGGDEAGVRAFVDRRGGLAEAMKLQAAEAAKTDDIWMVLHAAPAAFAPDAAGAGPAAEFLKSIQRASLGVKFGTDIVVSFRAVTHNPQEAENLVTALRLLTGLAAASQKEHPQVAELVKRLKLDTEGDAARLSLAIPEAEAETALRNAMAKTQPPAAPSPSPAPAANDPNVVTLPAPPR